MLTQEQIEHYHTNGYISVEEVLTPQEVEDLRRTTDEFIEKSRQVTESDSVFDLEPGHTAEAPRLRRIKNPAEEHEIYNRIRCNDQILDIVAQLIGPNIRCNGHKLNMKSAEFGSSVEWHQDWAFYPHTNDDLLAVGVAVDAMTQENGCLLAIPGSHKGRIYDHHQDGYFAGAVTEPDFDAGGAVPIEVQAGDISIHHVRALHGSAPNTSSNPRRLLLLQYCAGDAWPLVQHVRSWEEFNSQFVRGKPTLEPRVTEVPVRVPYPSGPKQGSIYEIQTTLKNPRYGRNAG